VTPEEKVELVELLAYRTRSAFDIRSDRLRAAEMRLGMWENGKFTGRGLAELMERARRHDDGAENGTNDRENFTKDEFAVLNGGFRNHQEVEEAEAERERRERQQKASEARVDGSKTPAVESLVKKLAAKDTIAATMTAQATTIAASNPKLEKEQKPNASERKNQDGIEAAASPAGIPDAQARDMHPALMRFLSRGR
jgi:hypothetical protein